MKVYTLPQSILAGGLQPLSFRPGASSACFIWSDYFHNTPGRSASSWNVTSLLWKQGPSNDAFTWTCPLLLAECYHYCFWARIQSLVSLRSHFSLAAKEGSALPASLLLGEELGEPMDSSAGPGLDTRHTVGIWTWSAGSTWFEWSTVSILGLHITFKEKPTPIWKSNTMLYDNWVYSFFKCWSFINAQPMPSESQLWPSWRIPHGRFHSPRLNYVHINYLTCYSCYLFSDWQSLLCLFLASLRVLEFISQRIWGLLEK